MRILFSILIVLFIGQFSLAIVSSWTHNETCYLMDLEDEDGESDSHEDHSETEKKEINHLFDVPFPYSSADGSFSNCIYTHYKEVYDEVTIGISSPPPKAC